VPEFDEELVNVNALREDQSEVERRLQPAAPEDDFLEGVRIDRLVFGHRAQGLGSLRATVQPGAAQPLKTGVIDFRSTKFGCCAALLARSTRTIVAVGDESARNPRIMS